MFWDVGDDCGLMLYLLGVEVGDEFEDCVFTLTGFGVILEIGDRVLLEILIGI